MSRKKSRSAQAPRHGPIPMPEQPPIYAPSPLGFPLKIPRGWVMRPIWRTRAARNLLVFCLLAPLVVLATGMLLVVIHALIQKIF